MTRRQGDQIWQPQLWHFDSAQFFSVEIIVYLCTRASIATVERVVTTSHLSQFSGVDSEVFILFGKMTLQI